jgi:hypothetical protein
MKYLTWTVEGGKNQPETRLQGLVELSTISYGSTGVGLTTDQVAVISVLASLFSAVTVVRALILGVLPNWQLKDRSVLEHLAAVDGVATGQATALGP